MRLVRCIRWLAALAAAALAPSGQAQAPAAPSPFVTAAQLRDLGSAEVVFTLTAAQQALELGFHGAARAGFAELLGRRDVPVEAVQRAALGLASTELAAGRLDEAAAALERAEPLAAETRLRRALLALRRRNPAEAAPVLDGLRAEDLPAADVSWLFVAQGMLAEAREQFDRAQAAYAQAEARSASAYGRVQIALARERTRLLFGQATPEQVQQLQRQVEQFQGRPVGFTAAGQQAVLLDLLGRKSEAQQLLQRQLALVAPAERESGDSLRLLLGLISGADSGVGQNALRQLLATGVRPDLQRIALQLLAGAAAAGDVQVRFRRELDTLIEGGTLPLILDDLLLYRARLALATNDYERAEADARALLAQFPGAPGRLAALNVIVAVAWELKRYRTAADAILQLQTELGTAPQAPVFAVLLAEAYFRAGDFRSAVDAYGLAALERQLPPGVTRGTLIFQQILAMLRADQLDEAEARLDQLVASPSIDPVSQWQAEWNFVKTLEVRGLTARAYSRINRVLAGNAAALAPADLQLQFGWLQARLSLDAGEPQSTLLFVDRLLAGAAAETNTAVPAALRREVAGTAMLLRAQALLALKRDTDGLHELEQLRRAYPNSDAAIYSFIVQAKHLSERGQTVEAQQLLVRLADEHKESPYAPFALYEAATNAERRGSDAHFTEAYEILERIAKDFPRSDLIFYARLKQGDLLRKLNDLGPAQVIYQSLVNESPGHHDAPLAELALADTMFAQVGSDPSKLGSAVARYERIFDLPNAPVDARIEAGYKWGYALSTRRNSAEARRVLWSVVARFLQDDAMRSQVGTRGRYWLGRTLLVYADLAEEARALEEARRANQLVLSSGVWGANTARANLARLTGSK